MDQAQQLQRCNTHSDLEHSASRPASIFLEQLRQAHEPRPKSPLELLRSAIAPHIDQGVQWDPLKPGETSQEPSLRHPGSSQLLIQGATASAAKAHRPAGTAQTAGKQCSLHPSPRNNKHAPRRTSVEPTQRFYNLWPWPRKTPMLQNCQDPPICLSQNPHITNLPLPTPWPGPCTARRSPRAATGRSRWSQHRRHHQHRLARVDTSRATRAPLLPLLAARFGSSLLLP
mmetsp:Transcript_17688/g.42509  ORF Transcript_17688/g.42509 Transcript_17688/m.42509 type:complete len:229 (-) Transcript_17688:863-1549(-)